MKRYQARIAVVGTSCSGTRYISDCLKHVGLDVVHEGLGKDGICCGFVMWNVRAYPFTWETLEVEHVVRIIRDPLSVAEALPYNLEHVVPDGHMLKRLHPDPVIASLRWWVLTHERIPYGAPMLRVGTLCVEGDWHNLLVGVLGHRYVSLYDIPIVPGGHKTHRWPRITREEWARVDPEYTERARPFVEMLEGR